MGCRGFRCVGEILGNGRTTSIFRAIRRAACVVDHVYTRLLEAGRIGFNHIPVEQREYLVERGVAVEIGIIEIGIAAVAEADVGRNQRQTRLAVLRHTVAVQVDEGPGVEIRVPLQDRQVFDIDIPCIGSQFYCRGKAVDDLVVPLVEDRQSEGAIGNPGKAELTFVIAFGECNILAVRISQAHKALCESQGVTRTAAVKMLVGRAAVVQVGDSALDRILARGSGKIAYPSLPIGPARIDDLRVREAHGDVETRRPKLLKVRWPAYLDESVMGLLSVERIRLEPLFPLANSVGCRRCDHAVPAGHQVSNDGLADQGRECRAIGLIFRAGWNHADQSVFRRFRRWRNRTRV